MQHPAHVTPVLFLQLRPEGNHHPEQEGIEIALEKEKSQESESDGQDCAHTFPTAHAEPVPADGTPASLEIKGYNIYRNGIKLNDAPVAGTEFTDATAAEGKNYEYMETTVYDKGESHPSNKASLLISGIDATRADGSIGIRTADGTLIVTGLQSGKVNVAATDGRIIRTADSAPVVRIPLPAGIYIVTAGNRTVKIAVK